MAALAIVRLFADRLGGLAVSSFKAVKQLADERVKSVSATGGRTMKALLAASIAVPLLALTSFLRVASAQPPPWAFVVNPPGSQSATDNGTLLHVPGSTQSFTASQLSDLNNVPDWHPDDHPPMPEIVAHGRKPDVLACGYCHLPNGLGRPENASLAGLPVDYIVRQVAEFKSGARKSSEPRGLPAQLMIATAKAATEEEVRSAAAYFASLKPKSWIKVVETETVPMTHIAGWMLVATKDGTTEPIGQRIIEMPVDLKLTELRDSESPFIAYVPVGSVKKGASLASAGDGKTVPCGICHGEGLRGLGPVPPLAGRSPSYIVRQLYDIQQGARAGLWTPLMAAVVANLDKEDLVAIAGYTASLPPN